MVDPVLLQIDLLGGRTGAEFAYWILAAFGGGAFGAAIGALPAFCFTGFAVIAGEAANAVEVVGGGGAAELGAAGLTGLVGFGPVFGPHISFAGGAAAAAYAAKQDGAMYEPGDGDYHLGKDIAYALGTRPDVLAVGGAFGIFGAIGNILLGSLVASAVAFDTIAAMVFISALVHRVVFGYSLFGSPRGDGYFDMSPFENEEMRTAADGGEVATDGGTAQRLAVEPWLPHQYTWGNVTMIGIVAGLLGGFLVYATGSMFLGFGISAASLTFLNLGVEKIPVTHHMTLPASAGAAALVAEPGSGLAVLIVGAIFGALGALVGEAGQRVFYAHGDTHVDPPAFAIAVMSLLIGILSVAGVAARGLYVGF